MTISEPLSLDQQFEKDNAEIAELLKAQGVEDKDPFSVNTPMEKVPDPELSTKELDLAENDSAAPEPEKKDDPPAEDPPPEVPPVTEPPVETPPVETAPAEEKKRKPIPWAEKRVADRKLAEAQRELEQLKAKDRAREAAAAAAIPPDDDFVDPLEEIKKKQEHIDGELKRQADENRQRALADGITRDEAAFKEKNPDYTKALEYVVDRARKRFEVTGVLQEKTEMILEQYSDHLDKVMRAKGIVEPTVEDAENTARDIGFALAFEEERQLFVKRTVSRGRSVAEAAYELALSEGYVKPAAAAPVTELPPATPPAKPAATPQERVARAAKVDAANASLSAMQTAGKAKLLEVRTQREFNGLSPKDQDKFVEQMELVDPNWLQNMPA